MKSLMQSVRAAAGAGGRVWGIGLLLVGAIHAAAAAVEVAFVITTDFSTGSSSVVDYCAPYANTNNVESVHSDAVARYFGGLIYVVNRFGADNIQVIDPSSFDTIRQFSVGAGSDPHDILVLSPNKAYVTRYNRTDLWIVDPSTGAHTGSVSLSGLADADAIPEMDHMARVGQYAFVTVQRLDRNNFYTPVGQSYVAVVDVTTDTLTDVNPVTPGTQSILLAGTNPFSRIKFDPPRGKLYVSCVGFFGLQDGGVDVVDPVALQSDGLIFTEANAGGDVNDVEIASAVKGYVIVSDASFDTILKAFNPQTGLVTGTVYSPGGYVLRQIDLSPKGELWLADRTAVLPGIRIFDTGDDSQITSSPIDVGLPPFDITFTVPLPVGIGDDLRARTTLGPNYPNPFNPATTIPFEITRGGLVRLSVYDVRGRLVRRLVAETRAAGRHEETWDGNDEHARPVPSGIYFARLEAADVVLVRKVTLVE